VEKNGQADSRGRVKANAMVLDWGIRAFQPRGGGEGGRRTES